ncbi:MAG: hypothetical protein ING09_09430 [Roseomonas sp.]|nr:hypothetical protein [Roseomonas sp.]MCA3289503.1 hypothetical protein [Roseomonas sp.]MCA3294138.1 hypothetical protein [Roseomonas sp.]MCA3342920.1 hypothetical protein [Roseomonas sp.]
MSRKRSATPELQLSQTSLQDALRRALRDEGGRMAVRVSPGTRSEAQRLVFALLREAVDVKGGSLVEIAPYDWLLTELPNFEAGKLQALLAQILGGAAVQLLPLPSSKLMLINLLNAARLPQFLEVPAAEPVSPLGLDARLDRLNLSQIFRRHSFVGITDTRLPKLVFQRLGLDQTALTRHLSRLAGDRILVRHAQSMLQKRVLEALGDEGTRKSLMGGGPIAPLLLDLSPDLLPEMPDAAEDEGDPDAGPGLYATLALQDVVSVGNLALRRKALRQGAWGIAVAGLSASALTLIEPEALPADWLILDWSPALDDTQILKALRRLDESRLILNGCDREAALLWGLSQGIHLYGGPWIEDIITATRMDHCSKAANCLRSECRARGLATAPSERLGCTNTLLLEGVLPEGRA